MSKDETFKIIVLGEAGVGKSSLIRRFTNGTFSSRTTTTVGVDRLPMKICVDNEELQFQVLDTAGSFGFRGLIKSYMTNIDAVVLMYDVSNKETFACLPLWTTLLNNCGKKNLTKVLVGNKRDLSEKRQVQFKNAKNYAEFEGMISMEVSVKQEESVDLVFQCIARELKLKKQLAEAQIEQAKKPQQKRLTQQKQPLLPRKSVSMDLIGYESPDSSPPRQFVRKLSMLWTGKKEKSKQSQQQQQPPQRFRRDSSPGNYSTMTDLSLDKKSLTQKHYFMW